MATAIAGHGFAPAGSSAADHEGAPADVDARRGPGIERADDALAVVVDRHVGAPLDPSQRAVEDVVDGEHGGQVADDPTVRGAQRRRREVPDAARGTSASGALILGRSRSVA